ncbi:DedA family protein [Octadecabacter sp. R77987]|uniref:DedA family protein n=1 Tax=Octadecabacter sp. R77987 TaxID=3093874 RepID=UPI003670E7E2
MATVADFVLGLVADYGVRIVFIVTFLSCLALPVPSSLLMLASGGFAATGDLSLAAVAAAAFSGAVLGDNTGYWGARRLGMGARGWLTRSPRRAQLLTRAARFLGERGGPSVFFSCWLVAPLGPYMNYVCGLTGYSWPRFALWGIAGEIVWVGLYVGLGYSFADSITAVSGVLGNASGFVTAMVLVIGLGWWLWRASRKPVR